MKRTIKLLALMAVVAVFAIPAVAQADQCNDENKAAWYKTFFDNYKGDAAAQKVAYDSARKYIDACPDDAADAQRKFMKKFVDLYGGNQEQVLAAKACDDAIKAKRYADEMKACKVVLAKDPDNVNVNTILGIAGLADASVLSESATYAAKAIQLIEGGKPVTA